MLVFVKDEKLNSPLLGIVVNKKIGNAVTRHRMTRLIRNIFLETIKKEKLEQSPTLLQYIAFEFCNDYNKLSEEIGKDIKKALS